MVETPQPEPEPPQQGISLDELAEAFAQVMGTAPADKSEPREPAAAESDEPGDQQRGDQPAEPEPGPAEQHDPCPLSPRTILEAMLFVGNRDGRPLSAARAAELMRDVKPDEISALVDELDRGYAANGCPYRIVSEGAGYRLALRKAFHPLRNRFYVRIREARLSQGAIDVLAIVAYQQPLTSEQIGRLRGKPSSHVLAQLVRRGLLRVQRQDPQKPRTAQYFTTDRFLKLFGLRSLDDLPHSEELQRL